MKNRTNFEEGDFKKSSLCHGIFHCVKVAHKDGIVAIKGSQASQQEPIYFDKEEWSIFVNGIKNGEFDF